MARRREKSPNQCVDNDVYLPLQRPATPLPTQASDLSDDRVKLLAFAAAEQHRAGLHPADYCYGLFGFHATEADRAYVDKAIERCRAGWEPWLTIARVGWEAWYEQDRGHPPPPLPAPRWPAVGNVEALDTSPARPEVHGTLPPTATYCRREWWWDANAAELTIEQEFGSGRVETDTYTVAELDPLPGLMGRAFELSRPDLPTPYRVVVGGLPDCTCPAGRHRRACKHLESLAALCSLDTPAATPAALTHAGA